MRGYHADADVGAAIAPALGPAAGGADAAKAAGDGEGRELYKVDLDSAGLYAAACSFDRYAERRARARVPGGRDWNPLPPASAPNVARPSPTVNTPAPSSPPPRRPAATPPRSSALRRRAPLCRLAFGSARRRARAAGSDSSTFILARASRASRGTAS